MEKTKSKVDLSTFKGARMFNSYVSDPQPAVCVTGKFDVTNIYKLKKKKHSFNAMMCYCIMQASQKVEGFHYYIDNGELYRYNNTKVRVVVNGSDGQLYYADFKYTNSFAQFENEYRKTLDYCYKNNCHKLDDSGAVIGTSAVIDYPFESFSLSVSPHFNFNYLLWGSFVKKFFKTTLNISLRFHHALVNGKTAAQFFNNLQHELKELKV